ncbi:hypothetical protein MWU60_17095 [Yoonia sp. F2084L]|uniref:hypothetical protein n=1 Tax=Yoonia sp. F2084L TaxID=2926419 RepID=UPI001FF13608|nr:hypothetical protein [Yoonia sp. F2084L]MCK0097297.1 hypothetical protein [Yoonia sp. F2084L]
MTQVDQNTPDAPKIGADKLILGLLAVLIVGALFYVMSQRQQALRSSPAGLNGLQVWMSSQDADVQSFVGGWSLNTDDIGLLILPLYDTDLTADRALPETQEELIIQQDEYDLFLDVVQDKASEVPTMLVLPKWRTGMRLTGLVHPLLLVERERLTQTLDDVLDVDQLAFSYGREPFVSFSNRQTAGPHEAVIYAAQTFAAKGCRPILGSADAMILAECPLAWTDLQETVLVLSDPDLINNHGLVLGGNAFLVRDLLTALAADKSIVIDYSRDNWLTRIEDQVQRDRTWADLMRFFEPPFALMWIGFAIATFLTLWRAALRFGPQRPEPDGVGASKMMAIGARARLMRLSNRDGALVSDYSKARLAATATALFGAAHARALSNPQAFLAYTQRRHPKHAKALAEILNLMWSMPDSATPAQAMAAVADLDRILEQITHDT